MSRRAAAAGFEHFLEPTMTEIRREFSVGRALEGTGLGPGGHVIDQVRQHADTIERRLVDPEFQRYRDRSLAQFRVLLDAVESDHPLEAFDDALLAHDSYLEALKPSVTSEQRAMVTEMILTRLYRLGNGLEPIVQRPEDEFWAAAEVAFDREEAMILVGEVFPFTDPLRTHRHLFAFEARIDPSEILGGPFASALPSVTIEYTDEATRAMTRAEKSIVRELEAEVRSRFEPTD